MIEAIVILQTNRANRDAKQLALSRNASTKELTTAKPLGETL